MEARYKIIGLVKENVGEDEFFWINSSHNLNNFVAANSRRSTISSSAVGVMPAKGIRLVVDRSRPAGGYSFLDKINAEFNAYILRPTVEAAKVSLPRPLIGVGLLKIFF